MEIWRPIRTDGTQWTAPPKTAVGIEAEGVGGVLSRYVPVKSHVLSCFNAAGALAVIINRVCWALVFGGREVLLSFCETDLDPSCC